MRSIPLFGVSLILFIAIALLTGCATGPAVVPLATIETSNLTLTIFENFDRAAMQVEPWNFEDHWGDHVERTGGELAGVEGAGPDGTAALTYDYSARFDSSFDPIEFTDTDVVFSVGYVLPGGPDDTGVTFAVNPGKLSVITVRLEDARPDVYLAVEARLTVEADSWNRLALPFSVFATDEPGKRLDFSRPYTVEIGFSYSEQVNVGVIQPARDVSGRLFLDDLGTYRRNVPYGTGMVAALDDIEADATITAELYESTTYVDYSQSDDGVFRRTPGVAGVTIGTSRVPGKSGDAQRFEIDLAAEPAFQSFVDDGQQLVLSGMIQLALPDEGDTLVFSARSQTVVEGDLDIYIDDYSSEYVGFEIGQSWTDIEVPIDPSRPGDSHGYIYYRFPVPWELMSGIVGQGGLKVDVELDDFRVR